MITPIPAPTLLSYGEVIALVQPSVVRLMSDTNSGSGFIIRAMDNSAYVATNAHVTDGRERMVAVVGDDAILPALLVGEDSKYDLAVLWVCCSPDFVALRVAQVGEYGPGDEVGAFGYPLQARTMQATWGYVGSIEADPTESGWDQRNEPLNLAPGNSGGPVVARTGVVVGVNSHSVTNQPYSNAVSAGAVHKRLPMLIGDHSPDYRNWPAVEWKVASVSEQGTLEIEAKVRDRSFTACDTTTRVGEACNPNVVVYRSGSRYQAVYGYRCSAWCIDQSGEKHFFYPSTGTLAVKVFTDLEPPDDDAPWHVCVHDNKDDHALLGCTEIKWQ